ncbi:tetratricopeptide repeat protein [uncultured Halomonas sp.]|uniref:tetratricopeptide repeat protein n=2 Tax=Halomonas TaxID=2745 RepID=UPI0026261283|nr:tetratricopeptide repeat protein [uncultured Halomonas sp.]
MRMMTRWPGALLVGLLLSGLAGCTTTRENLGSDVTGTLQPFEQESRRGPCGERYSADEGMELSMVRRMLDEERPRSALAYLEELDYAYPEAKLMQAEALREIGHLEGSSLIYQGLVDGCLAADALRGLGRNAFEQQRHDDALGYMRLARRASPSDPRIRNDLGYLLMLRGHHGDAIEEFMTALELDDGLGNAASNLVLALLQDGQAHRAEAAARRYRVSPEAFSALQAAVERRAAPLPIPEDPALEIDDETT